MGHPKKNTMRARLLALGVRVNRRLERRLLVETGKWAEGQRKRFWSKVKSGCPEECWEWDGTKNFWRGKITYGKFQIGNIRLNAHRVSFVLSSKKMVPFGMFVCHSCDNTTCVNPKHLWIGTNKENQLDASKKGRSYRASGELATNSKLTVSQVLEMRKLMAEGACERRISEKFGVCFQQVNRIKHRLRWNHI